MTVLVIGSSHVWALKGGSGGFSDRFDFKPLQEFPHQHDIAIADDVGPKLRSEVMDWLDGAPNYTDVVVMISGSDWLETCMAGGPAFDFRVPGHDLPEDPGAWKIPYTEIRHRIAARITNVTQGLRAMGRYYQGKSINIWCQEAPPAVADDIIFANFREEIAPRLEWVNRSLHNPPPSKLLRSKGFLCHRDIVSSVCKECGIYYIPAPQEANDIQGLLQAEFGKDIIHSSFEWGTLTLNGIERAIRNRLGLHAG